MVIISDASGCEGSEIFFIDELVCEGGEAVVDPSEIWSGESTNFLLYNYSGASIQWQFKTELTGLVEYSREQQVIIMLLLQSMLVLIKKSGFVQK